MRGKQLEKLISANSVVANIVWKKIRVKAYNAAGSGRDQDGDEVSTKLYNLPLEYMNRTGEQNLSTAVNAVLAEYTRLKREYQACVGSFNSFSPRMV